MQQLLRLLLAHTHVYAYTHVRMNARIRTRRSVGLFGRTAKTSFSNSFVTSVRGCYAPRIRSVESGNEAERIIRNLHDARDETGMRDGSEWKKSVTILMVIGTYACGICDGLISRYMIGVIFKHGHVRWKHIVATYRYTRQMWGRGISTCMRYVCARARACYTCPRAWCGCVGANARCARRCVEYSKFRQTTEPIASNMRIDAVRE